MNKEVIQTNRVENLKALSGNYSTKKAFCEAARLNTSQLSQLISQSRPCSDKAAREIELALGLQVGYMDADNSLPLGYVGIEDAAEAIINLVDYLHNNGIAMHQFDNDRLFRMIKFIFSDITDRGQMTTTQLENLLLLAQA